MMIIGLLLGLLFVILGGVNISNQVGLESGLPSQLTQAAVSMPELVLWILFIIGGIFLFIDVARRTRLFNGAISFIVGAAAIFIGGYPLLVNFNVLDWGFIIPRWIIPYFSVVLGLLLVWDNLKVN